MCKRNFLVRRTIKNISGTILNGVIFSTCCLFLVGSPLVIAEENPGQVIIAQDKSAQGAIPEINPNLAMDISTTYILGIEDVVEISVWQRPEFTRKVPIRPDGKITIDLIGDIDAVGLTPMQLSAEIQTRLAEYVIKPQVTLSVADFKSKKVYVQGEVNRPGTVVIKGKLSVLEAIAESNGPTHLANLKKVNIIRGNLQNPEIIPVDFNAIMLKGKASENLLLQNGDVVYVPPHGTVKAGYALDILLYPLTGILRLGGVGTVFR
jgi:polysaccharide biosynthesis/export protein